MTKSRKRATKSIRSKLNSLIIVMFKGYKVVRGINNSKLNYLNDGNDGDV